MAFLQRFGSSDKYRMLENKKTPTDVVTEWISKISIKHENLGGHKICPFARMPRVVAVDKLSLEKFTNLNDQITVYMETDLRSTYDELEELCKTLKSQNPNFIFLPDHPSKKNFIKEHETGNGAFPCIIVQTKQELDSARSALSKTDYYTHWNQNYLAEIRSFD